MRALCVRSELIILRAKTSRTCAAAHCPGAHTGAATYHRHCALIIFTWCNVNIGWVHLVPISIDKCSIIGVSNHSRHFRIQSAYYRFWAFLHFMHTFGWKFMILCTFWAFINQQATNSWRLYWTKATREQFLTFHPSRVREEGSCFSKF